LQGQGYRNPEPSGAFAPATEPVYQTVTDHVWVPDQFEDRQVRYLDRGVWCTRVDHVLVVPGHYEDRPRQVCLTEGHWKPTSARNSSPRGTTRSTRNASASRT
jgi:hypothetical protein